MDRRINKTGRQMRSRGRNTREGAGKWRLFYEIYPDLRWQPADSAVDWFEVALHTEMPEYRPPNHPISREVFHDLVGVAEALIQHLKSPSLYSIGRYGPYFTLHPPASGEFTQTTLSRSLSLVFYNVGLYTQLREPPILTEIKNQLSQLNVFQFQSSSGTICR